MERLSHKQPYIFEEILSNTTTFFCDKIFEQKAPSFLGCLRLAHTTTFFGHKIYIHRDLFHTDPGFWDLV
jgi:hypothetical protein